MIAMLGSLGALVTAVVGLCWLRARIVVVRVEGISMEPTLHADDRVVVRRLPASRLRAGQIVVIERPHYDGLWTWRATGASIQQRKWIIKRLAALPGEPSAVDPDLLFAVPSGHAVVLGDNTNASTDSRVFGLVPVDRILGVVVRRYAESTPLSLSL